MANPFDQLITGESNKQEQAGRNIRPSAENDRISISINKRFIERMIFIIIIAVLAGLLFMNPFSKQCQTQDTTISGAAVVEKNETASNELKPAAQPQAASIPPVNNTPKQETKSENVTLPAMADENKPFKTNFDFVIENVDYYTCGEISEHCDDASKPVKIKSIKFMMANRWKDFKPKIEAFWYEKDSSDVIKSKVRALLLLGTIKKGSTQRVTIDHFDSTFFDPTNKAETIQLKIYDNTELMGTATKNIP